MTALSAAEIESSAPNAWTGKSTSLVYESEATVAAFLLKRGKTLYSARNPDEKAQDLIVVTETVEAEVYDKFRGARVDPDQALLFPARGAYDGRGVLIDEDTGPRGLLDGISLLCEEQAAGNLLPEPFTGVKRQKADDVEAEYFDTSDRSTLAVAHPAAWRRIASSFPERTF
jgi:hypothetical protein